MDILIHVFWTSSILLPVGYYIAADASKYRSAATLSTPELSAGAQCLEFYYHASGEGQKEITLNVLYMGSHNKLLWTHSGDAGDNWNKVQLEIPQENSNYKVCTMISHLVDWN